MNEPVVEIGIETFGSETYRKMKNEFMANHGNAIPSAYWRDVASVAFDDAWKGDKWLKTKTTLKPEPNLGLSINGVTIGDETWGKESMLDAKEKFVYEHQDALEPILGEYRTFENGWNRKLSVTFDEIWAGKELDVFENSEYTPIDSIRRIQRMGWKLGFRGCKSDYPQEWFENGGPC